jgi:hypothetical protein
MKKYIFDLELYKKDCLDRGCTPALSWPTVCHDKEVIFNNTSSPFATGLCDVGHIVSY